MEGCIGALTDEILALKLIISTFIPFSDYGLVSLPRYRYGTKFTSAANLKNFKMAFIIILKNYYLRIIIKNLKKCNILSIFAFTNYGKFAANNLEKLCPRSLALASTIPVIGLEKLAHGLDLRFFLSSWPWPRTLCPRLHP